MKRAFPLSLAAAALLAALAGCGQTPPASPAGAFSGGPASSWSQDGGTRSDASAAPSGGQTAAPSDHSSVSSGGQGEERGIGEQEALAIALDNAGVPSSDASHVKIERDRDNGIPLYDIEFETGYGDYDFQVAMDGGAIVGADYEVDEEHLAALPENPISLEQAAALVQEKVPGSSASDVRLWEEGDDGRTRYEGDLLYGGIKYEFEIDPRTGRIFDWNADLRD